MSAVKQRNRVGLRVAVCPVIVAFLAALFGRTLLIHVNSGMALNETFSPLNSGLPFNSRLTRRYAVHKWWSDVRVKFRLMLGYGREIPP